MMIGQHGGAAAAGGASADRSVVGSNEGRREPVDEGCSMEASSEEDEDDEPLSQEERKRMAAVLMHRMDETHGNSDGRVEFEEFFPWYLSLLMLSHVTSYHAAWAAAGSRR